jgi:hypothetical protein
MQSADELLGQLRGVTGPEVMPPAPGMPWAEWLTALATVAGVAALVWRLWRRARKPLQPREVALGELNRLAAEPLAESLHQFDAVLRRYLAVARPVAAEKRSTPELRAALPLADEPWLALLEANDRDRFAGELPAQAAWSERLRRAAGLLQAEAGDPAGR